MQTYPNEYILRDYQNIGYDRDHIIQAWTDSRGVGNIFYDYLCELKFACERHKNRQTLHRITAETASLLKRIPRTHHLRLKFEGDTSLDYLELRKLGLFSKKAFRSLKRLSLDYSERPQDSAQTFKKRHMYILGNHMGRSLRKLQNLSIQFEFWRAKEAINFGPLLTRIQRNFVSLVSLKLSLRKSFKINAWVILNLERMFVRLRPTLKHLDLDFSGNESNEIEDFSEELAIMIANGLPKLESLCLNFGQTQFSTKVIRLLFRAACTHLRSLRSLALKFNGCRIAEEHWNSYPRHSSTSNLKFLKLNLENCKDLSRDYLYILRGEIISMCPLVSELSLSTLNCLKIPDSFYLNMEKEFCLNLHRLKRLKVLYSHEQETNWKKHQELLILQAHQEMRMEEEIKKMEVEDAKMKAKAGGEEILQLYYQTEMEEEQVPKDQQEFDEMQYLEKEWEAEQEYEKGLILAEMEKQAFYYAGEKWEEEEIQPQMEIEQAAIDLTEAEIRRRWGG